MHSQISSKWLRTQSNQHNIDFFLFITRIANSLQSTQDMTKWCKMKWYDDYTTITKDIIITSIHNHHILNRYILFSCTSPSHHLSRLVLRHPGTMRPPKQCHYDDHHQCAEVNPWATSNYPHQQPHLDGSAILRHFLMFSPRITSS